MSPPRLPQFPHLRRAGLVGPLGPRVPGLRCTASDRAAGQGSGGRRGHRLPSAACPRSGPPPRTPASPAAPFHSAPSPHLRRPIPALPPHLRRPPPSHSRAPPTCGTHHPPLPPLTCSSRLGEHAGTPRTRRGAAQQCRLPGPRGRHGDAGTESRRRQAARRARAAAERTVRLRTGPLRRPRSPSPACGVACGLLCEPVGDAQRGHV